MRREAGKNGKEEKQPFSVLSKEATDIDLSIFTSCINKKNPFGNVAEGQEGGRCLLWLLKSEPDRSPSQILKVKDSMDFHDYPQRHWNFSFSLYKLASTLALLHGFSFSRVRMLINTYRFGAIGRKPCFYLRTKGSYIHQKGSLIKIISTPLSKCLKYIRTRKYAHEAIECRYISGERKTQYRCCRRRKTGLCQPSTPFYSGSLQVE